MDLASYSRRDQCSKSIATPPLPPAAIVLWTGKGGDLLTLLVVFVRVHTSGLGAHTSLSRPPPTHTHIGLHFFVVSTHVHQ